MLTAKQESFIAMMKTNDELAWKGFQLLLQREDYPHFFDVLYDAGFFNPETNPAPEKGERENSIRIPYWRPLGYLKSVAGYAGNRNDLELAGKILHVVRSVTAWRDESGERRQNYHTNSTFTEILGMLPTKVVSLSDIDLLGQWLGDRYERMLVGAALDKLTMPHFLASEVPNDWEKAARLFFHATQIQWRDAGEKNEPTPFTGIDDFWLRSLINNHARRLGERAGDKAVPSMVERVCEAFKTPLRRSHSSVFRPAVEDDAQNHEWRAAENRVVEGLRELLLGWTDAAPNDARVAVTQLLGHEFQIIRRVGIYVLSQRWPTMGDLYVEPTVSRLFIDEHRHELYHLLQHHFADMNAEQQAATLTAIENLPLPRMVENAERLRRHRQYRWLSAINGRGNPTADNRFLEFDADPDIGRLSEHPDYESYITTAWVGPGASPYSPEELVTFANAKVLAAKLSDFEPQSEWRGPTTEGLSSAIEAATRSDPQALWENLTEFLPVKSAYRHAVINGLRQVWDSKADVNWARGWERIVDFFEKLVFDEGFWQAQDLHRQWVVSDIADILQAGSKDDEHAYNSGLLPRTQRIIQQLLARESGVDSPAEDAMLQAINSSKGRAIEALFSHALRAARISDKEIGSHHEQWKTICPSFTTELAKCKNSNYEFSTLAANYLPQLQYLDDAWATESIEAIFPLAYEANTVCALDGLSYAAFTKSVYELLASKGVISRGLDLPLKGRSARGKLLERIGAAFLWGLENIDGTLLTRVFDSTDVSDLNVFAHLYWMVRNENLTPDQLERILAFWDRCLEWVKQHPDERGLLLSRLSLLATYITELGAREERLLQAVSPYVHTDHGTYEFVSELLRLAPKNPRVVEQIFESMLDAHIPDYDYQDKLVSLLELLAKLGEKERVLVVSKRLTHLPGIEPMFKRITRDHQIDLTPPTAT